MEFARELCPLFPLFDYRIILDCQSFFNGVHYQKFYSSKWQDSWFVMLTGADCEEAIYFSDNSILNLKPYCLTVKTVTHDVVFNTDLSLCF